MGLCSSIILMNWIWNIQKLTLWHLVLPSIYVIIVIFMIIAYIFMTGLFSFGVLFVALIGMIVASCMKYQLTFGQLYLLGVYSRVLPLAIKAAIIILPFNIPYFWVINFGLSIFILVRAIQHLKRACFSSRWSSILQ